MHIDNRKFQIFESGISIPDISLNIASSNNTRNQSWYEGDPIRGKGIDALDIVVHCVPICVEYDWGSIMRFRAAVNDAIWDIPIYWCSLTLSSFIE